MKNIQEYIDEFHKTGRTTICSPTDDLAQEFEDYLLENRIMYEVEIERQCTDFIKE